MKSALIRTFAAWLILSITFSAFLPAGQVRASARQQPLTPDRKASILLAGMTPKEKIGQLFLVTFKGRQTSEETQIYDLLVNHRVGGVVLRNTNDNFAAPEDTIDEVYRLTSQLQTTIWENANIEIRDPYTRELYAPHYIPLLIAISQEGDGFPHDQIFNGTTLLPNPMAIGATWDTQFAETIGSVLGQELQALGINLYLGPSLDVLDLPYPDGGEDLGTRTFGGDPYWVGEMGKSYVTGLHKGSANRLAVVAKHFPGRGGSDRPPEQEVATVRKSLEQLKQIELAPFFAVTGNAPSPEATADGLLVSHIRYQGFQGNIRATTRPVSLDAVAFEQLMSLPQFSEWREQGGIVVSDDLGSAAIRRLYNSTGQTFEARQVARNAFLAGNDLLFVDNFIGENEPDSHTTILRTLDFFEQKYLEDPAFARRVDASVERILTLKYRLYPNFSLETVIPPLSGLSAVGQSQQVTFDIAQQAATLLSPNPAELDANLARPPTARDQIVFITDTLEGRQCSQCPPQMSLSSKALENAVIRFYGPSAGNQTFQYRLSSYSFMELTELLNGTAVPDSGAKALENDLRSADWVVFGMLNIQANRPESFALRRILSERPDLVRDKRVVVFAFNAPYYLDATDISKLSAYYALYSKAPAFVDMAARLLFQETIAVGALPVSVQGVGYDLIAATSPNPNQVISLMLDMPVLIEEEIETGNGTIIPTPTPLFKVGDILPLRTSVIHDHNGNPVPDGSIVRFVFTTGGEVPTTQQVEATTYNGVARTTFRIQMAGLLEIRAASEPATTSDILQLDITPGEAAVITAIAPEPTATTTHEPVAEPTNTPTPAGNMLATTQPLTRYPFGTWIVSMLVIWGFAGGVFWMGRKWVSIRWGIRWSALTITGGIIAYILFDLLALTPADQMPTVNGLGLLAAIIGGCLAGWLAGWLWQNGVDHHTLGQFFAVLKNQRKE